MGPIEKLVAEHEIILRGIDLLEKGADRLQDGETVAPEYFSKLVDFIRNYADKYHHAKEEDILFLEMNKVGFSSEGGPIAVMLYDHTQGRDFVARMEKANDRYASGDKNAIPIIITNARNYATLLKMHIQKENVVLYPMAENAMGVAGIAKMQPAFDKVEQEKATTEKKYLAILNELESM